MMAGGQHKSRSHSSRIRDDLPSLSSLSPHSGGSSRSIHGSYHSSRSGQSSSSAGPSALKGALSYRDRESDGSCSPNTPSDSSDEDYPSPPTPRDVRSRSGSAFSRHTTRDPSSSSSRQDYALGSPFVTRIAPRHSSKGGSQSSSSQAAVVHNPPKKSSKTTSDSTQPDSRYYHDSHQSSGADHCQAKKRESDKDGYRKSNDGRYYRGSSYNY